MHIAIAIVSKLPIGITAYGYNIPMLQGTEANLVFNVVTLNIVTLANNQHLLM